MKPRQIKCVECGKYFLSISRRVLLCSSECSIKRVIVQKKIEREIWKSGSGLPELGYKTFKERKKEREEKLKSCSHVLRHRDKRFGFDVCSFCSKVFIKGEWV